MRARRSNEAKWGVAAHAGLALLSVALLAEARPASAQQPPPVGIVCTDGVLVGTTRTFTLVATTGYINAPDGNVLYMWGFSEAGKPFQHPSPVLCANEGETVTVILKNTLTGDDVSIIFPGQEDVLANGAPSQPQFNASNTLVSLTHGAARDGGTVTYSFVATRPGTFLYESGTEPQKQVRMGLFGALLVRPSFGADFAYNRPDSEFTPGDDFMVLLSEVDPYLSIAVERAAQRGRPVVFNMNNYRPRYWFVNGRGFPDSIADNGASYLPSQPYGALARIYPKPPGTLPGMIRYLNVGTEDFPFHPHGNNGLVIGRDGHPLEGAGGAGPLVREVRRQHRPGASLGRHLPVVGRGGLLTRGEPGPHHRTGPREPDLGDVLRREPVPRHHGTDAARHPDPQPVRRVLHHLAQPRAASAHGVGRCRHGRSHHVPPDRSPPAQQLHALVRSPP